MTDVFISYSRKDSDFIRRLNDALIKANLKVWVDWEDIARGEDWWSAIQEGVEKTDTALIVVSENWLTSEVCHRELEYVRQHEKRVFPIIRQQIRGEVELRSKGSWIDQNWEMRARDNWKFLRALNWTSFDDDTQFDASFAALLKALEEDQPYIKAHTRYQTRGLEWERSKRNPGFLLAGDDLTFAERWLADGANLQPPATDLVRTYIAMSRAHEDARQARETLRENSIKQFRRAAIGLVAVVILAVIASLITGVSAINNQNNNATAQAQMNAAAADYQVQKSTAEAAFSTATSVAFDAATLRSEQDKIQDNILELQTQVANNGGTLTAIPPTQTQSAMEADIYSMSARGLLLLNYEDNPQAIAQALEIANQIIYTYPDVPYAYVASGKIKELAGYIEAAIENYSVAIARYPDYVDAYAYRAFNYESQEDWFSAIRDYNAIIQINENAENPDPLYYFYRGQDYYTIAYYEDALKDFDRAISLNEDYTEAYNFRGSVYYWQEDYEKALKDFDRAISLNPNYADAYNNRGLIHLEQEDYEKAFNDFNTAVSLDSNFVVAYYNRGLAVYLQESGDTEALVNDWNTYLQLGGELDEEDQKILADAVAALITTPTFTPTPS